MPEFGCPNNHAPLFFAELAALAFAFDEENTAFVGKNREVPLAHWSECLMRHRAMKCDPRTSRAFGKDLRVQFRLIRFRVRRCSTEPHRSRFTVAQPLGIETARHNSNRAVNFVLRAEITNRRDFRIAITR